MTCKDLYEKLWKDYVKLNPNAKKIHELFLSREKEVINDHIALRTYDILGIDYEAMAGPFVEFGYRKADEYVFKSKKLIAGHYEHENPNYPKIFISQIQTEKLSHKARQIIKNLTDQIREKDYKRRDLPAAGLLWERPTFAEYENLRRESEYASWVAVFGFCANHFTVLINSLKSFDGISEVNNFLKQNGFDLNIAGGEIKGSPAVYLEQSSTLAGQIEVTFADGIHKVPGCYYEFARRYPLQSGEMFSGFVADSADKIFESTDTQDVSG